MENRIESENITEPMYVVIISTCGPNGTVQRQKFKVENLPTFDWDTNVMYVVKTERSCIAFNLSNVISWSWKLIFPKKRMPRPERATAETETAPDVNEEPANEEG